MTQPHIQLHMNICLRCHTQPVKSSSWCAGGDTARTLCFTCDTPLIHMDMRIPALLLRDETYSEWTVTQAASVD
jgi:transcription elongation factor Elf1